MLYGIVIYFQNDEIIKDAIKEIGMATNSYMIDNLVRPHLTLALFEASNEQEVIDHFKRINVCSVSINPKGINSFDGPKNVVYLDCEYTEELQFTQNKYTSIPCDKYYEYYQNENFHPHITLGIYLTTEQVPIAKAIAKKYHFPSVLYSRSISLLRCDDFTDIVIKECE